MIATAAVCSDTIKCNFLIRESKSSMLNTRLKPWESGNRCVGSGIVFSLKH